MAEIITSLPIIVGCCNDINHIAFDGCNYFCTIKCKCQIIKLDKCLKRIDIFCTCREYNYICYDFREHCFWASSKGYCNRLFKLDCEMNEIDCICIFDDKNTGEITGVSYKCDCDTLVVSFACSIYEVEKFCGKANLLYSNTNGWIFGVLSLCPGMIMIVFKDQHYYIEVFDECNKKTNSYCIKDCAIPQDIIFNPCKCEENCMFIDLFVLKKCCYPYMVSYSICCEDLGFCPCECNFEICDECCCDQPSCCSKDACAEVMESIALMETALSQILNTESGKIEKVLATTDDIDEILRVNQEVNNTIINATHLEHVLYAKLSKVCDCEICEDCSTCDCQNNFCDI